MVNNSLFKCISNIKIDHNTAFCHIKVAEIEKILLEVTVYGKNHDSGVVSENGK